MSARELLEAIEEPEQEPEEEPEDERTEFGWALLMAAYL